MRNYFFNLVLFFSSLSICFSQNENIKSLVEKTNELNLDMWELTTFAEENFDDKEELARFFYYWIGSNIKYDHEVFDKVLNNTIDNKTFWETQDEYIVYNTRKGVCAGYAKLYQWFLDWVDIEAKIISGHIRDTRNHYVELELDDDFRHAWNAIKLNNEWLLVDTTWGTSNDNSQSEFYFGIKPEILIISHYPEDSAWQLLDKPLTLDKFNNSKFIKPVWFFEGFSDIPKMKEDEDNYYFVFKSNPKNNAVQLLYSIDNLNFNPISDLTRIDQDGFTYLMFSKKHLPERVFFKVNLYLKSEIGLSTYKDVINFKI